MKAIKRSTLLALAGFTREYARTGGIYILPTRIEVAKKLATQAYGRPDTWLAFLNFVEATIGIRSLYPACTDEELEELFKRLGFEIEEADNG